MRSANQMLFKTQISVRQPIKALFTASISNPQNTLATPSSLLKLQSNYKSQEGTAVKCWEWGMGLIAD